MAKNLLIHYTPRIDSNTARLVQTYLESRHSQSEIEQLDLVLEPAPFLLQDNLNALLKRNFIGMDLDESENDAVAGADKLVKQLLGADQIVMAFPMYNFSIPAVVKAWVDAVIQLGKTFKMTEDGGYEGLCQGKRALVLMTTGGDLSQEPANSLNFATPLIQTCMGFMGIESHCITAYGLNQYMDKADEIVAQTQQDIVSYLNENRSW